MLFTGGIGLDPAAVTAGLRAYHPTLANTRCELAGGLNQEGKLFGLIGWGDHVIQLVGFAQPMPSDHVEVCVAPSHYPQPLKEQARAHRSHVLLWYAGGEESVVEQYVALAVVAGVLADFGAIAVLNETARTSFPAAALSGRVTGDMLHQLRTLPLPACTAGS